MENKIRRINIVGGPGLGKTVSALQTASRLKAHGMNIEYVPEYCKKWAISNRKISAYDQLYLFGRAIKDETELLNNGVDLTIADGSVYLTIVYGIKYGINFPDEMRQMYLKYEKDFPSLNIFLTREQGTYTQAGRYESETEAIDMDLSIRTEMKNLGLQYHRCNAYNHDQICDTIIENLK